MLVGDESFVYGGVLYEGILGIKKPTLGLDIGFNTLKVVQIKGEAPNGRLLGAGEAPIPENSLTKEGIKDKQKIADAIKKALSEAKPHHINAKIVSSALPESLVFTKNIDVPKMSESELAKNIPFQATEFFPIPAEETYMDWQILGNSANQGSYEIMVVAAPKVLIDSLIETVKLAGLELLGLENKPLAVIRSLIPHKESGPFLMVDIGAKTSGMICYDQGTIKLTSTITCGGDDLQKELEGNASLLSQEINHLIKYYQNRIGQAQIFKKIILAGGGANVAGTAGKIQELTKIKTEIGTPVISLKNYNSRFAVAIGLALKRI